MNARNINTNVYNIRTYIKKDKLTKLLESDNRIVWWRACVHDKDADNEGVIKEQHIHAVIEYKSRIKMQTVINYFGNILDDNSQEVNTHVEICKNIEGSLSYLQHKKEPEKYQYPDEEVFGEGEVKFEKKEEWTQVIEDEMNGTEPIEMVKKYGTFYIKNVRNIELIAATQIWKDNVKRAHDIDRCGRIALLIQDRNRQEKLLKEEIARLKQELEQMEIYEPHSTSPNEGEEKSEKG